MIKYHMWSDVNEYDAFILQRDLIIIVTRSDKQYVMLQIIECMIPSGPSALLLMNVISLKTSIFVRKRPRVLHLLLISTASIGIELRFML